MYKKKIILFCKYGLAVMILLLVGVFGFKVTMNANDTSNVVTYNDDPGLDGFVKVGHAEYEDIYSFGTKFNTDINLSGISGTLRINIYSDDSFDSNRLYYLYFDIKNFQSSIYKTYDVIIDGFKYVTLEYSSSGTNITLYSNYSDISTWIDVDIYNYVDDLEPVISSEKYIYITSVDNPTTIINMMTAVNLTAIDAVDGDITSKIQVVSDGNYTNNVLNKSDIKQRTLGDYAINFSVSDNAGNIATCTITIRVVDTTKPVVNTSSSTLSYTVGYYNPTLTLDTIINGIVVTDNYSSKITKAIIEDNYSVNKNYVGSYTVKVQCTDDSGNSTVATVTITVYDNEKPVFSGATTFYKSYEVAKSANDIISFCNIKATDEIDGELTIANGKLKVLNDNYTGKANVPGIYNIVLRATDTRGNYADYTITVTIGDDVIPFFLINKNTVIIESGVNFTSQMLLQTLKDVNIINNKSLSYTVVKDTYSGNEDVPGEYDYNLKVLYEDGIEDYVDLKVQVLESKSDGINVDEDKPNIIEKIWNFIVKVIKWIWNTMKWLFNTVVKFFKSIFSKKDALYFMKL